MDNHQLRLVHPIAEENWITRIPATGDIPLGKRRSPKRGRAEHLFYELVYIAQIVKHPNFSLEILITEQEEIRRDDGKGSWRRKGWSVIDHRLIEVRENTLLASPLDYLRFIPASLPEPFTNRELSEALSIPGNLAQKIVYCLRKMDVVEVIGKRGRSNLNILSNR